MQTILNQIFTPIAIKNFIALGIFFFLFMVFNIKNFYSNQRYLNKNFWLDGLYTFLLVGGIYGLITLPVVTQLYLILKHYFPYMFLNLLQNVPDSIHFIIFLVVVDFCRYWKHRWMHSVRFLRPFHLIHHAAEELNFLTNYRIHLVEHIVDGLITLIPVVILGAPGEPFLLIYFILIWYGSLLHSDLNLSYGWLDNILISPRTHSIHHSNAPQEFNTNYGVFLSIWDVLFKTAHFKVAKPKKYGIKRLNVPNSFIGQFFFSFRFLWNYSKFNRKRMKIA